MPHSNCSVCQPPKTSFSARPIATLETLARILRHSVPDLEDIAATADRRYRIGKQERKKDGSLRICYDALGDLKSIQARIQCKILHQVEYPTYLQGSIRDPISPRGQRANARLHIGQRVVITQDIKQFFPSVRTQVVFDIWNKFFKFPPVVAQVLTKLTTKDGSLPQGTKTSALLANLVFWDDEWREVSNLHVHGITYTRLIDDITVSSPRDLSSAQTARIITALHAMVHRKGLKLNRGKQSIARACDRQVATKLLVNVKTALPSEQRSAIRAAVQRLRSTPQEARNSERYQRDCRRASGRVAYLKQHHPKEAEQLRSILRDLRSPRQNNHAHS